LIKWYWIFVSLSVGISIGFGITFFNLRHLLLLAVKKPGGSLRPLGEIKKIIPLETIKEIVEQAIEIHELGKTTDEIIEEMNNLPRYKP